jgi:hypothetical protein
MQLVDPVSGAATIHELEIEGKSLTRVVQLLGTELLRRFDGSQVPPVGSLRGLLVAQIELQTWASLSSCGVPDAAGLHNLHAMQQSAKIALSSGGGLRRPTTPTGGDDSCLN